MRALVTGWVRSSSGTRSGPSWVRRNIVSKNAGIAFGIETRAGQHADADAVGFVLVLAREVDARLRRQALRRADRAHRRVANRRRPRRQAGSPPASRPWIRGSCATPLSRPRAMWRCVTCATSCASTPASSLSFAVSSSSPECTPMKPPGSANALIGRIADQEEIEVAIAVVREARQACSPSDCRYSPNSGSSTHDAGFAQAAHDHASDPLLVLEAERQPAQPCPSRAAGPGRVLLRRIGAGSRPKPGGGRESGEQAACRR